MPIEQIGTRLTLSMRESFGVVTLALALTGFELAVPFASTLAGFDFFYRRQQHSS